MWLHSRGSGADNLRNFTSNPTAGIDPYELIDVSPFVKDLAHTVINRLSFMTYQESLMFHLMEEELLESLRILTILVLEP